MYGPILVKSYDSCLNFSIYSKENLSLLWISDRDYCSIHHISKNYIIVEDRLTSFNLLEFEQITKPKLCLRVKKRTILDCKINDTSSFEYPFICIPSRKEVTLIDVRTGVDVLEKRKLDNLYEIQSTKLTNNYLYICSEFARSTTLSIVKLHNVDSEPIQITVKGFMKASLDQDMLFIHHFDEQLNKAQIVCHNLVDGTKSSITYNSTLSLNRMNGFIVCLSDTGSKDFIYKWVENYKKIELVTQTSRLQFPIKCFHDSLPLLCYRQNQRFLIVSKTGKIITDIEIPKSFYSLDGDKQHRIYALSREYNDFYLHMIDFHF